MTTRVTYSAGFTRNMGNFESLRLDMGVEGEPLGDETTAQAFNRVKDFVESRLLGDIEALENQIIELRKSIKDRERERLVKQAAETEDK